MIGQRETAPVENREIRILNVISGMIESGDYLTPRLHGRARFNKPPFYYWLGAAAQLATRLPDRVAYRLPSVLAGLGMMLCVYLFCRSAGLEQAAPVSALSLSAMMLFTANARIANFDMLLGTVSFASVSSLRAYLKSGRFHWLLWSGFFFAAALLTKATPAFAAVTLPSFLLLMFQGKTALFRKPSFSIYAFLIPVLLGFSWEILMLSFSSEARQSFHDEALLPFGVADEEHHTALHYRNFFFYFLNLFKIALPTIIFLPLLVIRAARGRLYREKPTLRWAVASLGSIVLVFSLIPQKQINYMTVILPYLALLFGEALAAQDWNALELLCSRIAGYAMSVAALVFSALFFGYFEVVVERPVLAILVPIIPIILGVVLILLSYRRAVRYLFPAGLALWWYVLMVFYSGFNIWATQFNTGEIYRQPYYRAEHWNKLFADYPRLQRVFRVSSKFKEEREEDDES